MRAQTDGITSIVVVDNQSEFATLIAAIPSECRIAFAYSDPADPSGITINRLGPVIKIVHMYFKDGGNYSALGVISPLNALTWNSYPVTATITDIGASRQATVDINSMELRYRTDSEPSNPVDLSWLNNLGVKVDVTNPPVVVSDASKTQAQIDAENAHNTNANTVAVTQVNTDATPVRGANDANPRIENPQINTKPLVPLIPPNSGVNTDTIQPASTAPVPALNMKLTLAEKYDKYKKYWPWAAGILLLWIIANSRDD